MVIKDCGPNLIEKFFLVSLKYAYMRKRAITINHCGSVHLHNLDIRDNTTNHGLLTINVMGYSLISEVTCNGIIVVYKNTLRSDNYLEIKKHNFTGKATNNYRILLAIRNNTNLVCIIEISDTMFLQHDNLTLVHMMISKYTNQCIHSLQFTNCTFDQNTLPSKSLLVIEGYNIFTNIAVSVSVTFSDCELSKNIFLKNSYLIDVSAVAANITLKNNNVYRNWHMKLIMFSSDTDKLESAELYGSHLSKIFIENTKFWENEIDTYIISTSKASLRLDKVTFFGNSGVGLIAMNFKAATLRLHGQITIAFNKLAEVLYDIGKCAHKTLTITIEEDTEVMIRFNNIYTLVGCDQQWLSMRQPHLPCFFQFYSKCGNLDNEFYHEVLLNYSITF